MEMKPIVISFGRDSDIEDLKDALAEINEAKMELSAYRVNLELSDDDKAQIKKQDNQIELVGNLIRALIAVKGCEKALDNANFPDITEAPMKDMLEALAHLDKKAGAKHFSANIVEKYFT